MHNENQVFQRFVEKFSGNGIFESKIYGQRLYVPTDLGKLLRRIWRGEWKFSYRRPKYACIVPSKIWLPYLDRLKVELESESLGVTLDFVGDHTAPIRLLNGSKPKAKVSIPSYVLSELDFCNEIPENRSYGVLPSSYGMKDFIEDHFKAQVVIRVRGLLEVWEKKTFEVEDKKASKGINAAVSKSFHSETK